MGDLEKNGFGLLLSEVERESLWKALASRVEAYVGNVASLRVPAQGTREQIRQKLAAFTFEKSVDAAAIVDWVSDQLTEHQLHTAHPSYYGVFNPNPASVGIAAEALTAAFNPQLASSASSLFCIEVEEHLLRFFSTHFGLPLQKTEGCFTSGGTEANHTALLCALTKHIPDFATQGVGAKPVLYATRETHHSILRVARLCGLGTHAVVELPTTASLQFDVEALETRIQKDRKSGKQPLFLVGTLGSTSAGVVDPLQKLAEIAREYGLWFHVDAAWGGAACLLPELQELVRGVGEADSVTLDPHKWLSMPMGIGMFLTRHPGLLRQTFGIEQSFYMPSHTHENEQVEPYRQSMPWSRRFNGLKLFMALATHGLGKYQSVLRHQISIGEYLRTSLSSHCWTVVNETPLPVVCFVDDSRPGLDLEDFAAKVAATGKAWITTTVLTHLDRKVLRAGIPNFLTQKTHIDALVALLSDIRAKT